MRIVPILLMTFAVVACVFEPDECSTTAGGVTHPIPPTRRVPTSDAADSGGIIVEDAGSDGLVGVRFGTVEEWSALPCAEACRRLRREGFLSDPHAFSKCSTEETALGLVVRCDFEIERCRNDTY